MEGPGAGREREVIEIRGGDGGRALGGPGAGKEREVIEISGGDGGRALGLRLELEGGRKTVGKPRPSCR